VAGRWLLGRRIWRVRRAVSAGVLVWWWGVRGARRGEESEDAVEGMSALVLALRICAAMVLAGFLSSSSSFELQALVRII